MVNFLVGALPVVGVFWTVKFTFSVFFFKYKIINMTVQNSPLLVGGPLSKKDQLSIKFKKSNSYCLWHKLDVICSVLVAPRTVSQLPDGTVFLCPAPASSCRFLYHWKPWKAKPVSSDQEWTPVTAGLGEAPPHCTENEAGRRGASPPTSESSLHFPTLPLA